MAAKAAAQDRLSDPVAPPSSKASEAERRRRLVQSIRADEPASDPYGGLPSGPSGGGGDPYGRDVGFSSVDGMVQREQELMRLKEERKDVERRMDHPRVDRRERASLAAQLVTLQHEIAAAQASL